MAFSRNQANVPSDVARHLEQSAHLLESLDLYPQADALRETANQLRRDARKMNGKAATGQGK